MFEDFTIPEFLRRTPSNGVPKVAPPQPGNGFNLVGKPYGNGFTMPKAPPSFNGLPVPFGGNMPAPMSGQLPQLPFSNPSPAPEFKLPLRSPNELLDLMQFLPGGAMGSLARRGLMYALGRGLGMAGRAATVSPPAPETAPALSQGFDEAGFMPDASQSGDNPFMPQVPLPRPRPQMPQVPLPQPRPQMPTQDPTSFYNGPGSFSFGAGDAAPGMAGSNPQTDLLRQLIAKLQGQ